MIDGCEKGFMIDGCVPVKSRWLIILKKKALVF